MNGTELTDFLVTWTAAERAGDVAALERLLADDFLAVGPLGFFLSRQDWLDRHATGALTYRTFELTDTRIRQYGDVTVVWRAEWTTDGVTWRSLGEIPQISLMTRRVGTAGTAIESPG